MPPSTEEEPAAKRQKVSFTLQVQGTMFTVAGVEGSRTRRAGRSGRSAERTRSGEAASRTRAAGAQAGAAEAQREPGSDQAAGSAETRAVGPGQGKQGGRPLLRDDGVPEAPVLLPARRVCRDADAPAPAGPGETKAARRSGRSGRWPPPLASYRKPQRSLKTASREIFLASARAKHKVRDRPLWRPIHSLSSFLMKSGVD